jgi:MSHA biogenesis protein MshL
MMKPHPAGMILRSALAAALLLTLRANAAEPMRDPMRPPGTDAAPGPRASGMVLQIEASPAATPATPGTAAHYDIRAVAAPTSAFFGRLAEVSGSNILVHPEINDRLSLTLKQVSLVETLQAVRDLYGLDYQRAGSGYMIVPATVQTRVFQLNYLDLHRSGVSHTRVSSGQVTQGKSSDSGASGGTSSKSSGGEPEEVSGTSVVTENESDFWKGIEADLRLLMGGEAKNVVVNRQSGVIVVRGMPAQLRDVANYLQRTQSTVTRQVILEAKIVEVELNSGYQAGINWSTLLTHGNQSYFIGQRTPPAGFGHDPLTPPDIATNVTPGVPIVGQLVNQISGAFTLAVDATDFNGFIQLLDTQGRTRVLSSPRVSTLHNQKAIIKAGSDEFFVTGVKSDITTGTATTTSLNVELTPFFSGVALDVTPQVSEDGTVLLHIHPTVSEVTDQTKRVEFGGGSSNLPLAFSQIRESDSVVRAHSGQLIVIGGLMRETRKREDYKTPLLGDVPGLGKLFKSQRDQSRTVELVLLLRPLVPTDSDWESLAREPQDRATALAARGDVEGTR